jgi:phosphatidate cytidylyltransferase
MREGHAELELREIHMLRWRLVLGTLFIALLIALCGWDHVAKPPGLVLFPLALLLSAVAAQEYLGLLAARGLRPEKSVVYAGSIAVVGVNVIPIFWKGSPPLDPLGWPLTAFGLSLLAAFVVEMWRYETPGASMERLALAVLGVAYAGLLMAFIVQMRLLGDGGWGVPAIGSLVIVVKMSDIGAFTAGRLWGKHKMTPTLSPGKTWEGAAGGMIFACVGSGLALALLMPLMTNRPAAPLWAWLSYGLVVGGAGILGDLAESLIKRDVERKDSSAWMPGFGGVLDMLDSVLFAAPIAFLMWKMVLVRLS